MPICPIIQTVRKGTALLYSLIPVLLALAGCRAVGTYQAARPVMATPSEYTKGEVSAVLPSLESLPTAYFYGVTTNGLTGWLRPGKKRFLIAGEGFFWHDVSKFTNPGGFLNTHIDVEQYSGITNGFSGGLGLGTYWTKGTETLVLLGGYSQEYSFVRHHVRLPNPTGNPLSYDEVRYNHWGKLYAQIHLFTEVLPVNHNDADNDPKVLVMAGYRANLVIDQGLVRHIEADSGAVEKIRQIRLLRYLVGEPKPLSLVHQPFVAFKAEGKHLSAGLRFCLGISSNRQYLKQSYYQIETVIGLRF